MNLKILTRREDLIIYKTETSRNNFSVDETNINKPRTIKVPVTCKMSMGTPFSENLGFLMKRFSPIFLLVLFQKQWFLLCGCVERILHRFWILKFGDRFFAKKFSVLKIFWWYCYMISCKFFGTLYSSGGCQQTRRQIFIKRRNVAYSAISSFKEF